MIYLKALFLFVASFLAATAADTGKFSEVPVLKKWEQQVFYQEYVRTNQQLPLFGLLNEYRDSEVSVDAPLTIRQIRQHGIDQHWSNFMIESRTDEGKGGAINFAAADFLMKALPSFLEDKGIREKIISDVNQLLKPEGSEGEHRALTLTERRISLEATLWAVACYPSFDSLQHYNFEFWRHRYFSIHYKDFANVFSPTLTSRSAAAALATYHILGQGAPEEVERQSAIEATQFANLRNEVAALIYAEGPLGKKFALLRSPSSSSKGLERPTQAVGEGELAPLFTGESPTSPYVATVVDMPGGSGPRDPLLPSQNLSCWRRYQGALCCGGFTLGLGGGALLALGLTGHL